MGLPTRESPQDVQVREWALPRNGERREFETEIWLDRTWFPKLSWLNGPSSLTSFGAILAQSMGAVDKETFQQGKGRMVAYGPELAQSIVVLRCGCIRFQSKVLW